MTSNRAVIEIEAKINALVALKSHPQRTRELAAIDAEIQVWTECRELVELVYDFPLQCDCCD